MPDLDEAANEIEVDPTIVPVDLFTPIALLGQGALGVVYLCIDKRLGKKVAVKCLSSLTDNLVVSFQNEARIASKLNHPSVIRILDFGIAGGGRPYMVMEYFEGRSLQDVLDQSTSLSGASSAHANCLAESEALELFLVVCDALSYLHRNHVFHRDLKPSNILVRRNETGDVDVRLIDFNLSKTAQDVQSRTVIQGKTVVGTPLYMSPDQIAGSIYDARSEVYSLGCVMYETLTGVPVFEGESALEILNKHAHDPIVSPLEHNPDLSENTVSMIEKCLVKDREKRFQTIDELIEQLQQSARQLPEFQRENRTDGAVDRKQIFDAAFLKRVENRSAPRKFRKSLTALSVALIVVLAVMVPMFYHGIWQEEPFHNKPRKPKKTSHVELMSPLGNAFVSDMTDAVSTAKRKIDRGETVITIPVTPTDEDMKFFATQDAVTTLNFPESSVTDAGILQLAKMKQLKHLAVDRSEVYTLENIPKLKNLESLSLRSTKINDDCLLNLKGMKLSQLRILHTDITDRGVANLVGLPLRDLDISDTNVTDNCIDSLVTFKEMQYLGAQDTKITAEGARKISEKLNHLLSFDVRGSLVTSQQRRLLEREFPTIRFRDDNVSVFDTMAHRAHKLLKEDRVSEALTAFQECETVLEKRYGVDFQQTKDFAHMRKFCEKLLKQRAEILKLQRKNGVSK